jgi:membrane associated rhomboid family serine protease
LLAVSPRGHGDSHARARAYATWALIALTIAVYLVQFFADETRASEIVLRYGLTPAIFSGGERPFGAFPPLLTPLTSIFLHGSWDHLAGNMIYLWVFGDDIEEALGPWRFIAFYFLAGIAAALAYVAFNPGSTIPLVGASGAISGVLAAYLMLRPCAKVTVFVLRVVVRVRAFWVIGGWGVLQLFSVAAQSQDGVAYLAHVGGFAAGAALFYALRPTGVRLFECMTQDAPANQPSLT